MTIVEHIATAADLELLPDDGFRYELVRGEVRKMTPAGNEHGKIAMSIAWRLAQHVENHGLGSVYAAETGFRLASDPDTVRAPDAAFVCQARLDAVGAVAGYWPGAPDLAVEVVSPGDRYGEVAEKVADWLAVRGRRWWSSSSRSIGTVAVHRTSGTVDVLREGDVLEGEEVVPGWGGIGPRRYSPSVVSKNA